MGYDALSDVVTFNEVSGNEMKMRETTDPLVDLYIDLIGEESKELSDAYHNDDLIELLDGAGDVIVVAAGLIAALGYHPNDVLKTINDSNMSKFCYNIKDAEASVLAYKNDGRYEDVHYKEVREDVFVIYGRKVGGEGWKILKGVNYSPPILETLSRVKKFLDTL